MDNYIVSARKYRPNTFRPVVGQEALTTTLKNAIISNKLAHAYLFSGPRGGGKTTCARIFAKTINCFHPTADHEACNACESCVAFNEQRSYNIHELDAASNNGVDDIRALIEQVRIPPQIGKYKVYIIDEVHMLSTAAFNSFLKTLEEPPAHAIFILATTEKHKIIPTILSRCQVYDFNRIKVSDIVHHLDYVAEPENIKAEVEALNVIAQKADGGMRDALSIFDQMVSYTGGNITYNSVIDALNVLDYEYYFKLTDTILAGNVVDCLLILNDIYNRGFEGQYIIGGLASHFRDLLVCKDPRSAQLFQVGSSIKDRYIETAKRCSNEFLYQAIDIANTCDLNYRASKNKRLLVELTMIRLCQLNENSISTATDSDEPTLKPIQKPKQATPTTTASPSKEKKSTYASTPTVENEVHEPASEEKKSKGASKNIPPKTATPQKKRTVSINEKGISISELNNEKKKEAASESKNKKNGFKPFTEENLINAWKAYADALTEEKLLNNTMSLYLPKLIEETLFEVEVNTDINKQYLEDNSTSILSYLREKLQNDDVAMTIKIAEGNAIKKPLTSREIFDEMAKQNPSLQKLSDEFGLELS